MNEEDSFLYDTFPQEFLWGVATSAFQCEGGTKAGGNFYFVLSKFFLYLKNIQLFNTNIFVGI